MSDFAMDLPVTLKDGRTYTIRPVFIKSADEDRPAARIYDDNENVVSAVYGTSLENAIDNAFETVKELRKSKPTNGETE